MECEIAGINVTTLNIDRIRPNDDFANQTARAESAELVGKWATSAACPSRSSFAPLRRATGWPSSSGSRDERCPPDRAQHDDG